MADSWYEYLQGSPEQRLADLESQQKRFDSMKSHPLWSQLTPEQRMAATADQLYPTRNTEAFDDLGNAAQYVLDAGTRPRDTAIRAVQEATAGNPAGAAALAVSAIPSAVVPSMAAGTPGSGDDWRKHGNPAVTMALDIATDPLNYVGVGLVGRVASGIMRGADDAAGAIRRMRYSADLSNLPPWAADDIAAALPRPSPDSSMEAMMQARRMVRRTNPGLTTKVGYSGGTMRAPMHPHEWDAAEAERFGDGYYWTSRLDPRGRRRPARLPQRPIQPYPLDPSETRMTQRNLTAQAILDKAQQNPDILSQLPPVFRLPIEDRLIARLAAEGSSAYLPVAREVLNPKVELARKFLSEHPELIGAGAVTGGGVAYGVMGDE